MGMQRIYASELSPEEYVATEAHRQVRPELVCPCCEECNRLHRHGTYERGITTIERWFYSCQTQFLPTLTFEPVRSFEELNRHFWRWLETAYHQREHAALSGESPAQRFARLGTALRLLEPNVSLERLFLMRVKRRVRKDATFSLEGEFWEVAPHLRGQIVTVREDE